MATEFKVVVTGTEKLLNALRDVHDKINGRLYEIVRDATIKVEVIAKKSMIRGGGGGRMHSVPGEPPFVQSGQLRANITIARPTVSTSGVIEGKVGVRSNIKYALALEFGYPPRNLKERPFMRPALATVKPDFDNKVRGILKVVK